MEPSDAVRYGMKIRLRHIGNRGFLRSVAKNYRHPRGSEQQIVGTAPTDDRHTWWIVKPAHGILASPGLGDEVSRGSVIRLEHVTTHRNLHSHTSRSPLTGQQEVTAYGEMGEGDANDNWRVELDDNSGGNLWLRGVPIRLRFSDTNGRLHSHFHSDPDLTAGMNEVTVYSGSDANDLWQCEDEEPESSSTEDNFMGTQLRLNRTVEAPEGCLNTHKYAEILAAFLTGADRGEFCFALFGNWGRGKTYLMDLLAESLKTKKPAQKQVVFSAWKYPTTPEVWVHLYEKIAEAAEDTNWFLATLRNIRTGIARHGSGRLLLAALLFTITMLPKFYFSERLWHLIFPVLGIGGLIWLFVLAEGIHGTINRLWREFLTVTRHGEKLGLQATIGKDLTALLVGWMPKKTPLGWLFWVAYLPLVAGVAWSTYHWLNFLTADSPVQGFSAFISVVTGIVGVALALAVSFIRFAPMRVVLVVDDLDRCSLEHLLLIIESIKLLLEDQKIHERLQVVMLLEEGVLQAAIKVKYQKLLEAPKTALSMSAERIVREKCEKLFNAHLRLEALTHAEIRDVFFSIGANSTVEARDAREFGRQIDRSGRASGNSGKAKSSSDSIVHSSGVTESKDSQSTNLLENGRITLSRAEQRSLWKAMRNAGLRQVGFVWAPRTIRALTFRYQLARMILVSLDLQFSSKELAEELVNFMVDGPTPPRDDEKGVVSIVRQVS